MFDSEMSQRAVGKNDCCVHQLLGSHYDLIFLKPIRNFYNTTNELTAGSIKSLELNGNKNKILEEIKKTSTF